MAYTLRWYSNDQYFYQAVSHNVTESNDGWLEPITSSLAHIHPVAQAFIFTLINWLTTTLGAAAVFLTYKLSVTLKKKILESMFGFGGGVMLAAAFWGLLVPANDLSQQAFEGQNKALAMIPLCGGFVLGIGFLFFFDIITHKISQYRDAKLRRRSDAETMMSDVEIPEIASQHSENGAPENASRHSPTVLHDETHKKSETIYAKYRRTILLVVAVTLHNIPEGIVVGFAFAAAGSGQITLSSAITLSLGVGIQNIPEGLAVSLPCQREGMSTLKAFVLGSISGFIEPLGGLIGSALMLVSEKLLPYALAFAAGCMIFVVISELVPEITGANHHLGPENATATTHISHEHTSRLGVLFFFVGFVLMMILDVTLS